MSEITERPASHPAVTPEARTVGQWYDHHYATATEQLASWEQAAFEIVTQRLRPTSRFLDLGCGPGHLLAALVRDDPSLRDRAYGFDISRVAVEQASRHVVNASVRDITAPGFADDLPDGTFDAITMLEVVEHLIDPTVTVREAVRLLAGGGILCCSFPTYLTVPWLALRLAAELLDRPALLNLQPIDRLYTFPQIKRRLEGFGLIYEHAVGATYPPPYLHRLETTWLRRALDRLGLAWLAFHPVLVFRKPGPPALNGLPTGLPTDEFARDAPPASP
jgi:2-polyprenyl-3-methyl-5-hydroxy-6-metoxy-1,4-benzoquinol methylase